MIFRLHQILLQLLTLCVPELVSQFSHFFHGVYVVDQQTTELLGPTDPIRVTIVIYEIKTNYALLLFPCR